MSRTIVYIDGFNLYYRALRGTPHKWLDIVALSTAVLPSNSVLTRVYYYTARVSGRTDPKAPARQHACLQRWTRFLWSRSPTATFRQTRNGPAS